MKDAVSALVVGGLILLIGWAVGGRKRRVRQQFERVTNEPTWLVFKAACNICRHRWVAVVEPGWQAGTPLECSNCGSMAGDMDDDDFPTRET